MYNFPLVLDCVAFNFPNIKMPAKVRKFVCNGALVGSLDKTVRAGSIALRHHFAPIHSKFLWYRQRYTYRVLQTIQMKLILLGSAKTALKSKYEIQIG